MKIFTQGEVGFCEFTSSSKTKASRPSIALTLKSSEKNFEYLQNKTPIKYLLRFGKAPFIGTYFTLLFEGNKKIIKAIELFMQDDIYNIKENEELFSLMNKIKAECEIRYSHKKINPTPLNSKPLSHFEVEEDPPSLPLTSNPSRIVRKISNPEKRYVLKDNIAHTSISELEAFNADCFRLLLGNRHPKVHSVHNENGEKVGVVSRLYSKYESIHDYLLTHQQTSPAESDLLKYEVIKVWASALTESEFDLHGGNYGKGPDDYYVKIDDDMASWELSAKFHPAHMRAYPKASYPLTANDILQLPQLTDAKPYCWPDRSDENLVRFSFFIWHKKCQDDKYYMFLKRLLIPNETYAALGEANIRSAPLRQKAIALKQQKTLDLELALLSLPEFKEYVNTHPSAIEDILNELHTYNLDYAKEKYAPLRVDLEKVSTKFKEIQVAVNRDTPTDISAHRQHNLFKQKTTRKQHGRSHSYDNSSLRGYHFSL